MTDRSPAPRLSVVSVNYGTLDYLRACLRALAASTLQPEFIVVDNDGSGGPARARVPAHPAAAAGAEPLLLRRQQRRHPRGPRPLRAAAQSRHPAAAGRAGNPGRLHGRASRLPWRDAATTLARRPHPAHLRAHPLLGLPAADPRAARPAAASPLAAPHQSAPVVRGLGARQRPRRRGDARLLSVDASRGPVAGRRAAALLPGGHARASFRRRALPLPERQLHHPFREVGHAHQLRAAYLLGATCCSTPASSTARRGLPCYGSSRGRSTG